MTHSRFFVVDEFPGTRQSPATLGGTAVTLHLYVRDVDMLLGRNFLRPLRPSLVDLLPRALQQRAADWTKERQS